MLRVLNYVALELPKKKKCKMATRGHWSSKIEGVWKPKCSKIAKDAFRPIGLIQGT